MMDHKVPMLSGLVGGKAGIAQSYAPGVQATAKGGRGRGRSGRDVREDAARDLGRKAWGCQSYEF